MTSGENVQDKNTGALSEEVRQAQSQHGDPLIWGWRAGSTGKSTRCYYSLVPSIHMAAYNHPYTSSRGIQQPPLTSAGTGLDMNLIHTRRQNSYT